MSNINIIGNGFDLYHGLPTSYYYFACYILLHDEEFYDELASMYGFSKGIMHHVTDDLERGIDDCGYWNEFERRLGLISSSWIEDSLLDDLNLEYPDAVDLDIDKSDNVEKLQSLFEQWINETIDLEQNYQVVEKNIGAKKLSFLETDEFISFNYTHTLEEVYDMDNVFHIHGSGKLYGANEVLIIGHGNNQIIKELSKKIQKLDVDDFDQPSRNRKLECKSELEVLNALKKPVEYCMEDLRKYLDQLKPPEKIIVWGFSLCEVDLVYINEIRRIWPECRWSFSYFNDNDKERVKATAKQLNLNASQWDDFMFKNEFTTAIQDEILLLNKVDTYPRLVDLLKRKKL